LFSAVSSSFVIDIQTKLEPDPNDMAAAYLRAILLTLNHSAIPGEFPTPPTAWSGPASEIVLATNLLYASLLITLLAAFVAMLGKQWLNRYLRDTGGSNLERCGDRQRKRNGVNKWPFEMFIESLPMMLQVALLLLAVGLTRYMWAINVSVARTLLGLTAFGMGFFILIVVAGTSSYECPFQTPASLALRALGFHRTFGRLASSVLSLGIRRRLRGLGRILGYLYFGTCARVTRIKATTSRTLQRYLVLRHAPTQLTILPHGIMHPGQFTTPLYTSNSWTIGPVMKEQNLALPRKTNLADARCIYWILDRITDPEAINSALRLACTIRWYDDGVNSQPSYEELNSVFVACFGFDGRVHPGTRNRAYDCARVIGRLFVLAWARSEALALTRVPVRPPSRWIANASDDPDLRSILSLLSGFSHAHGGEPPISEEDFAGISTAHTIWVSNLLLHLEWARRDNYETVLFLPALLLRQRLPLPAIAIANILMTACLFLGWRVNAEVLLVDDKSYVHGKIMLRALS
jgi:hypothetical protein